MRGVTASGMRHHTCVYLRLKFLLVDRIIMGPVGSMNGYFLGKKTSKRGTRIHRATEKALGKKVAPEENGHLDLKRYCF